MKILIAAALAGLAATAGAQEPAAPLAPPALTIMVPAGAPASDRLLAELLRDRIRERSNVAVTIREKMIEQEGGALILGTAGSTESFTTIVRAAEVKLPGPADKPFAEGYAVKGTGAFRNDAVVLCGADQRGTLYAIGAFLRACTFRPDGISYPKLDIATAPAWRWRGSSANQGGTMMQLTGARGWTEAEHRHYMLDLALSGANLLYAGGADREFVRQFDLMTEYGVRPNQMRGEFPPAWQSPTERGEYVCPSVPEARAALLTQWDADFAQAPDIEVLRFFAGDPGGCRCDRCAPWGRTFVLLCEEIAALWLKHHPNTEIEIANQDIDNQGDAAIIEYLNERPRAWLDGISYGPGSNPMSEYFRPELRADLFEYAGHGPSNRFLRELLQLMPARHHIVHYSDISHWISAQFEVEHPDPYLAKLYGRRTFHTRPQAFYDNFQQIMPFAEGDIIYSEGYHDEFHQFMWNRLLWNPNQTLNDVMMEYATYYFGLDAAPEMVEAMLQLEKNLEIPLAENDGVQRYYGLVASAGKKIPANLMKIDHRWRLHMQKAALDRFYQQKLRNSLEREHALEESLQKALEIVPEGSLEAARALIAEPLVTPEMDALWEEAGDFATQSDALWGVKNEGLAARDREMTNLGWLARQVEKATSESPEARAITLKNLVNYEEPVRGALYDDAGNPTAQPHLIKGENFDGTQFMDPANRPSHNTIAYNLEEDFGIVLRYEGLNPRKSYTVKLTLASPRLPHSMTSAPRDAKRTQHLLADGEYIARDMEVPEFTAQQVSFEVPKAATEDGALELTFERAEGSLATVVSEVWLLPAGE